MTRTIQAILLAVFLCGCLAKVTVVKRPNLALPICHSSTNNLPTDYVIVDQGYEVRYFKIGFSTDIESMSAEINSNKTVSFTLGGLHSTSPTNAINIKFDELLSLLKYVKEVQETNDDIDVKGKSLK